MKCKKCKKLIHLLVDGELDPKKKSLVCKHLRECDNCQAYHNDLVRMCAGLREPDSEPPKEFQENWKREVRKKAPQKKGWRPGVLVPAVACGAAAVFVVSTAIVNPQALGLSGDKLESQWFMLDRSAVQETATPEPKDPGPGVDVEFYGKKEKKPNVVDFESSDYSETITSASVEPELYSTGEIAKQTGPEGTEEAITEPRNADHSENSDGYAWDASAFEMKQSDIGPWNEFVNSVSSADGLYLTQWTGAYILEGSPEKIQEIMTTFDVEVPEGTKKIRLLISD